MEHTRSFFDARPYFRQVLMTTLWTSSLAQGLPCLALGAKTCIRQTPHHTILVIREPPFGFQRFRIREALLFFQFLNLLNGVEMEVILNGFVVVDNVKELDKTS